ncbi:udp-galactose 4- [Phaffia rhodozyma]|uniref:Udp-galactose 4 n=1 Tax=Phaffia rhodozyma TaxID=264483 RepID=A0A0F7SUN3_PHARH|nr:udp-galactose 4- [Phaffia rhodozyma]
MKIALTGARGSVGQSILKHCNEQGHYVFEINRRDDPETDNPLSEHRRAEGTDYEAILKAFEGADAVIHVAAVPNPGKVDDATTHNSNVSSSYVALRAAAELGIKRFSLASSVNALGLEFSRFSTFDYFPLDDVHPTYAEDPYSMSKYEAEKQADGLCRRYDFLRVASFRMHEVSPKKDLKREPKVDQMVLWSYSDPEEVAKACLLGVTVEKDWKKGHEVFYCVSPENTHEQTRGEKIDNETLAQRYYPNVPVKKDLNKYGFFDTKKIEDFLGWKHAQK